MLPPMTRFAIAVAAGAMLLAACGAGDVVEATVNGKAINTSDVEGLLYEVRDQDHEPAQFATYLSVLIQWEAIRQGALAEFGFEPTEEAIDAGVRDFVLGNGFTDLESFLVSQNVSEEMVRQLAGQILIERHLHETFADGAEPPTLEDAQQALDADPRPWTEEVCASHILVETAEEAEAALARIDAGEEFSALAAELSIDTGNAQDGGSLGCASPGDYVDEFADASASAPIGVAIGPVQTQFGHHLILVGSRITAPLEEIQQGLIDELAFTQVEEWLSEMVRQAVITVEENRGTWSIDPLPQVIPPPELG